MSHNSSKGANSSSQQILRTQDLRQRIALKSREPLHRPSLRPRETLARLSQTNTPQITAHHSNHINHSSDSMQGGANEPSDVSGGCPVRGHHINPNRQATTIQTTETPITETPSPTNTPTAHHSNHINHSSDSMQGGANEPSDVSGGCPVRGHHINPNCQATTIQTTETPQITAHHSNHINHSSDSMQEGGFCGDLCSAGENPCDSKEEGVPCFNVLPVPLWLRKKGELLEVSQWSLGGRGL